MQKVGWIYFLFLFLYSGLEFTLPFLTHIRFDFDKYDFYIVFPHPCVLNFSMQQGKVYLFTGLLMLPIQAKYVRKTPIEKWDPIFKNFSEIYFYYFQYFCLLMLIKYSYPNNSVLCRQKAVAEFGIACIIPAYLLVAVAKTPLVLYAGLFFYAIGKEKHEIIRK